jgi:hypothetical protein
LKYSEGSEDLSLEDYLGRSGWINDDASCDLEIFEVRRHLVRREGTW